MASKNMGGKIKTWYCKQYPDDELGLELNPKITFTNILFCLFHKEDIYPPLWVYDSVLCLRVFEEIAKRLGTEYRNIYNLWIN